MGPFAFDFWLGNWDCVTEFGPATNSITREFSDNVIIERFHVLPPQEWTGMSVSVFSEQVGWRQTWVDQDGNYWAFVGCLVDGDPCFATEGKVDRDDQFKRMVFTDITDDSLFWRWEVSGDGVAWAPRMTAAYTRRTG